MNRNIETLAEAKEHIEKHREHGLKCPCCGQFTKLYKRRLNSGMAVTLIRMYQHDRAGWINVKDFLRQNKFRNNHDWTLLRFWGLIVERDVIPEHGGKSAGQWKLTEKGRRFVMNQEMVPERILLYNNIFEGYDSNYMNIKKALGKAFNYNELMASWLYEDQEEEKIKMPSLKDSLISL